MDTPENIAALRRDIDQAIAALGDESGSTRAWLDRRMARHRLAFWSRFIAAEQIETAADRRAA